MPYFHIFELDGLGLVHLKTMDEVDRIMRFSQPRPAACALRRTSLPVAEFRRLLPYQYLATSLQNRTVSRQGWMRLARPAS